MFDTKLSLNKSIMIAHSLKYIQGTDGNNHIVRCTCGWGHSNTKNMCEQRADLHIHITTAQKWNDPKRNYHMPSLEMMEHIKARLP